MPVYGYTREAVSDGERMPASGYTWTWPGWVRGLSVAHSPAHEQAQASSAAAGLGTTRKHAGQATLEQDCGQLGRHGMIQRTQRGTETPGKPCLVFLRF